MNIKRLWEDNPTGTHPGMLKNWPIPPGTTLCAVVIDHGEGSEHFGLVQQTYFWHYLLQGQKTHHYRRMLGSISFKEEPHGDIDILTPPDGHTPIYAHYDDEIRKRLDQIAGYFLAQGIREVEAYTREGKTFDRIELNPIRPLHPPNELIMLHKPLEEAIPKLEGYRDLR